MINVYLAGQPDEYENNWKQKFQTGSGFVFFDWEIHADQSSAEMFFPQDLEAIKNSHVLIANPGTAPSEGTWFEIGYFYALNTNKPGEFCDNLIIIWNKNRVPKWSYVFIERSGHMVTTVEEAKVKLYEIGKQT